MRPSASLYGDTCAGMWSASPSSVTQRRPAHRELT
jgi:hypothetical protein